MDLLSKALYLLEVLNYKLASIEQRNNLFEKDKHDIDFIRGMILDLQDIITNKLNEQIAKEELGEA